jgi:hypothetical protein
MYFTGKVSIFFIKGGLMIETYTPVNGGKTKIALFLGETDV